MKKTVAISLLGSTLDAGRKPRDRWSSWRPSVALCQQTDLVIDRLELLYDRRHHKLARTVAADIQTVSPETSVVQHDVSLTDPWNLEEVYSALHQFSTHYDFQTDTEDYFVHITTGTHVAQICLFLLTESRHIPGRLIQTVPPPSRGKPRTDQAADVAGTYQIFDLDLSRYDKIAQRFGEEKRDAQTLLKRGIATRDKQFNSLIDQIERVSLATDAPILLTGPTGAGKTQLAKRIYDLKHQRRQVRGPLVHVNCATIRGDGAMSTLFGHVKGAFTGASGARPGLLRSANGGMLFLDEIGELGLDEQAMLLRAIEEKSFTPVGSDRDVQSDFQIIAGTNRDLIHSVAKGNFRDDLLARINLWSFRLPGLAERRDDIDPNIDFELNQFTASSGTKVTINREARSKFLSFAVDPATPWHGNFRDLSAAIRRMATLASAGRITPTDVDAEIGRLCQNWRSGNAGDSDATLLADILSNEKLDEIDLFDRPQLASVIRVCRQSRTLADAGRTLFQSSRQRKSKPNDSDRLRKYLAKFDLAWSQIQTD